MKFLIATACGWLGGFAASSFLLARGWRGEVAIPAAYLVAVATTAVFHLRYVRTQREFLLTRTPWRDFVLVSLGELTAATVAALWLAHRARDVGRSELFVFAFGAATVARYVLRKELMQDIRGLRRDWRREEHE